MKLGTVLARRFEPVRQRWGWRDAALYAIALGMGSDPLDAQALPFVYERAAPDGLKVMPSMVVTLGWLPFWQDDPACEIDWRRIVHGEMSFELHRPLAAEGKVMAEHRIVAVDDKGPGRGAVMHVDKRLIDASSGAPLATLRSVEFLRGDGGCGAWAALPESAALAPIATLPPLPDDFSAEHTREFAMPASAALLYRLASGDFMPIHADPAIARAAGFERPISHGLHNLGLACRAILERHAPQAPERLRAMAVRFMQPGLPGDTVCVESMRRGQTVYFRAHALERNVLLLDRGRCRLLDG